MFETFNDDIKKSSFVYKFQFYLTVTYWKVNIIQIEVAKLAVCYIQYKYFSGVLTFSRFELKSEGNHILSLLILKLFPNRKGYKKNIIITITLIMIKRHI